MQLGLFVIPVDVQAAPEGVVPGQVEVTVKLLMVNSAGVMLCTKFVMFVLVAVQSSVDGLRQAVPLYEEPRTIAYRVASRAAFAT
jgi:hypothetical protein